MALVKWHQSHIDFYHWRLQRVICSPGGSLLGLDMRLDWNKSAFCVSFRPSGASVHPCAVAPIAMVTITQQRWWKRVSCRSLCRSSLPHHVCLPLTGQVWAGMCVIERTRWKREKKWEYLLHFDRTERDLTKGHYAFFMFVGTNIFSILIIISL